jgi:AcrR family transcriptional regulator
VPGRKPTISIDQLLDAGEAVVLREGVGNLTLDAVAAQAKVSKGGLLHHFPSKRDLVAAMVTRLVQEWNGRVDAAIQRTPPGPGRLTRATINACIDDPDAWQEHMRRRSLVLLTAIIADPSLIKPVKGVCKKQDHLLASDGLAEGAAEFISAALDGIWMSWVLGMRDFKPAEFAAIRRQMMRLVNPAASPRQSTSRRAAARPARKPSKPTRSRSRS